MHYEDPVFSGIWYVLGDFGQEIEGIEHLEVAGRPGQQFVVPRFGESAHRVVLGLVLLVTLLLDRLEALG